MAYRNDYRRGTGFTLGPIGFLIAANIILWVATSIRPELFIDWLGFSRNSFSQQPWTILTSMFVHAPFPGFSHIFGNMFTLYFFGHHIMQMLGEKKLFLIYFLGGFVGNLFFMLMAGPVYQVISTGEYIYPIAIGASGGVSAVAGALMVLRPKMKVFIFPLPIPIPIWGAVIGLFVLLSMIVPGVAWQAHLGGVIFGAGVGYFFRRKPVLYF